METFIEKKNLLQSLEMAFAASGRSTSRNRRLAMDMLLAKGLPGPKTEEYRFTPITRALEKHFTWAPEQDTSTIAASFQPIPDMRSHVVAFVNGKFSAVHSRLLDNSVAISTEAPEIPVAIQDPFALLNCAFSDDIIHITVGDNQQVNQPLLIVYYIDSSAFVFANPRWVLHAGAHSKVT